MSSAASESSLHRHARRDTHAEQEASRPHPGCVACYKYDAPPRWITSPSKAAKKGFEMPAPKTTPTLPVKDGEKPWTKAETTEVVEELNEQRTHSLEILAAQEKELSGLMHDSGDGAGLDQADVGASSFERDQELTVVNSERDKLAQIERALDRISQGTYGMCESCGEPIGKMRLMAFPRATLCMTCKQREERR